MHAITETRRAPLWEEFGIEYATRLFGAEMLDALPRFTRGPKKGQINAWLIWMRATTGGWCRECQSPVRPGGLVRAWIGKGPLSLPGEALRSEWLGRTQQLCGSNSVLGKSTPRA